MRVLTWNLYHGRAHPASGRVDVTSGGRRGSLLDAFSAQLAGWEWDVALLQEVPPWWPTALAAACGAQERHVLTSRNALLPLRRAVAGRAPDLLGANGGGANAILVRGDIVEHRARRLRVWPERRSCHAVRLADGTWAANLHAHNRPPERALADTRRALAAACEWSAGAPLVFGGDVNLRRPPALPGLAHVAGNHVDHLFARGLEARAARVLDSGGLSDHAPVAAELA